MIKAVIPSYHSVEEDHGKSYTVSTVYCVFMIEQECFTSYLVDAEFNCILGILG